MLRASAILKAVPSRRSPHHIFMFYLNSTIQKPHPAAYMQALGLRGQERTKLRPSCCCLGSSHCNTCCFCSHSFLGFPSHSVPSLFPLLQHSPIQSPLACGRTPPSPRRHASKAEHPLVLYFPQTSLLRAPADSQLHA